MDSITGKQLDIIARLLDRVAEIKVKNVGKLSIVSALSEKGDDGKFRQLHLVLKGYMIIKKINRTSYVNNFLHNCKAFEKEMIRKFNKGVIY